MTNFFCVILLGHPIN